MFIFAFYCARLQVVRNEWKITFIPATVAAAGVRSSSIPNQSIKSNEESTIENGGRELQTRESVPNNSEEISTTPA